MNKVKVCLSLCLRFSVWFREIPWFGVVGFGSHSHWLI